MKARIRAAIANSSRQRQAEHEMVLKALARLPKAACESDQSGREDILMRGRGRIHPNVLAATADELIAAGWGWHERCLIPPDFQKRRPVEIDR